MSSEDDREAIAEFLANPVKPDPNARLRQAFSIYPENAWYLRTGLGRLWATRRPAPEGREVFVERGTHIARLRKLRQEASELRDLPDVAHALDGYQHNIETIIDVARAEGLRVVFMTQPTLWRDDLSPADRQLLWMGGPPFYKKQSGAWFYSVEALAEGMELYNQRLREVCEARAVPCLDLAKRLPKTRAIHWDDAHFTEEGARRVAALVTEFLSLREPFVGQVRRDSAPERARAGG